MVTPAERINYLRSGGAECREVADEMERLLWGLNMIGNNLAGQGFESLKPISAAFAARIAELAFALANGEPHQKFDETVAASRRQSGGVPT